ncbi:hypothetical protein NE237_024698 [Protea cynaroides]|uniref:DNA/RNA-binding protein Alba-like domain-containing protein n=1 Tax=Protea cynaroides TaxID=273540 RepID=A0A9Q0JZV4_9MAGN|nr:hypothetical protein NE237_024698 [Protea cynaroides]
MDSDSEGADGRVGTKKQNEIWVCTRARLDRFVRKTIDLLEVKGYNEIILKALGKAVDNALEIADTVKENIDNLHGITYTDPAGPVSNITITLSKKVENEIWVNTRKNISNYVRIAIDLLQVKGYQEIVLKAMGRAVQNASEIAESVKRSIAGLHESKFMDFGRPVLNITITLSKKGLNDAKMDSIHQGLRKITHGRAGTRKENEIWIRTRLRTCEYARNAIDLLEVKGCDEIVLKAMGKALHNALEIAESVKRNIAGLHESTYMDSTCLVSNIAITLSKKGLTASSGGYQCSESGNGMGDSRDNRSGIGGSRDNRSGYSGREPWTESSYKEVNSGNLACGSGSVEKGKKEGSIFCLKNNALVKEIEKLEDCFILEFNPFESVLSKKLSQNDRRTDNDEQDLSVIAERGQVACRDYPHSRHLCVKFPFNKTPHESYCEQCYCYVCDSPAPCNSWTQPEQGHCHATDQVVMWKILREAKITGVSKHDLEQEINEPGATYSSGPWNHDLEQEINEPTAIDSFGSWNHDLVQEIMNPDLCAMDMFLRKRL